MSLGEIIAVSFPSAYFAFSILLKYVKLYSTTTKIVKKFEIEDVVDLTNILTWECWDDTFKEYIIISIINGIHVILILIQPEIGVLFMIIGICLSLLGDYFLKAEEEIKNPTKSRIILRIMFSLSIAQIGYYIFFNNQTLFYNIYIVKWVALFGIFITFYFILYPKFIDFFTISILNEEVTE